jgi:polyisoprenoid-binding protein YceI
MGTTQGASMSPRNTKTATIAASILLVTAGVGLAAGTLLSTAEGAPAAAPRAAAAFKVDGVHSSAVFKIKHNNVANFYGTFNGISGDFDLQEGGSINVIIDAASVNTGNGKRDEHLESPDFFSAKEYPEMSFKSTSVKKKGDTSYEAAGTLTMHGQSKPLTVTIEQTGTGEGRGGPVAGLETKFTVKRSEYGINYGLGKGLSDEVDVIISLEGGQR